MSIATRIRTAARISDRARSVGAVASIALGARRIPCRTLDTQWRRAPRRRCDQRGIDAQVFRAVDMALHWKPRGMQAIVELPGRFPAVRRSNVA